MRLRDTGETIVLTAWATAIRAKLASNGQAIGDATAQFYYLFLYLDTDAQATVLERVGYARDSGEYDNMKIFDRIGSVSADFKCTLLAVSRERTPLSTGKRRSDPQKPRSPETRSS